MNDIIAKSLGIEPVTKEEKQVEILAPEVSTTDDDFDRSRQTIQAVLDEVSNSVDEAIEIAQASQHHLAYQAVNALLKTKLDAARELLALQKEKRTIKKMDAFAHKDDSPAQVTHNNLFVGTTQEMLAMIEKARDASKEQK